MTSVTFISISMLMAFNHGSPLISKPSLTDFESAASAESYGCSILEGWAHYFDDDALTFESVFGADGYFFNNNSKVKLDHGKAIEGWTDIKTKFAVFRGLSSVSYDDAIANCERTNHIATPGQYSITVELDDVSIATFGNAAKSRRIRYKTRFDMDTKTVSDYDVNSLGPNKGFLVPLLDAAYTTSTTAVAAMEHLGLIDITVSGSQANINMITTVLYVILGLVAVSLTVVVMCGVHWMCQRVKTPHKYIGVPVESGSEEVQLVSN